MMNLQRILFVSLFVSGAPLAMGQGATSPVVTDPVEIYARRFPGDEIEKTNVRLAGVNSTEVSPAALSGKIANFAVGQSGGRSFTDTYALRGLANTPLFGDPSVTVYVDDLPLGSGFTFPSELVGFDSVEVFRGPGQATRFGRAGTAGVMRFSTPQGPATGETELRGSFGNYSARTLQARASGSAGGTDAYAAVGYAAREGYIDNTTLGKAIDGRESESGLLRLRTGKAETGQWSLLVMGQRVRDGVQPLVPLGDPMYQVARSAEGITHLSTWSAALRGEFLTGLGKVATSTSYSDWNLGPATSVLSFGFAELENASELRQRLWSEELSWSSDPKAPTRARGGLFLSSAKTDGAFTRAFSGQTFEQSVYRTTHESAAVFGEVDYKLSPSFTLTPGFRAELNKKRMDRREIVPYLTAYRRSNASSAFMPKLEARYDLDARTAFSVGVSSSYKPGGFSAFTGNRTLASFASERVIGFDAAIVRHSADQRWSAALRAFAYRIRGYQIERSFQTGAEADDYLVVNADKARSLGGELEFTWKPITGLTIAGSFGVTRVTLQDFRDPYTGINYKGNRAPYAPSYNVHLSAAYRHASGWFGELAGTATGRTFYTESESPFFSQAPYALLGGRAGYEKNGYRVSIFGQNLTNRAYYSSITPGTGHGTPGAPRTYGVEFAAKF